MIEIVYHKRIHTLEVKGHAGGKRGTDVVCAGVSALVGTLAQALSLLKGQRAVSHLDVQMEPGNAKINCKPRSRMDAVVGVTFDTICIGLDRLAEQYPKKIQMEIR